MCDCDKCHEAHLRIQASLDSLKEQHNVIAHDLEFHLGETHQRLVMDYKIQEWDEDILSKVDNLAAAVLGPTYEDFDGVEHRDTNAGMQSQMDTFKAIALDNQREIKDIKYILSNGGVNSKLVLSDKVTIAVIAAIATIVAAVFGS